MSLRYDETGRTTALVNLAHSPAAGEVSLSGVATDLYWTLGLHELISSDWLIPGNTH